MTTTSAPRSSWRWARWPPPIQKTTPKISRVDFSSASATGKITPSRSKKPWPPPTIRAPVCAARTYEAYERVLRKSGALDFDDLLLRASEVLRRFEDARTRVAAALPLHPRR